MRGKVEFSTVNDANGVIEIQTGALRNRIAFSVTKTGSKPIDVSLTAEMACELAALLSQAASVSLQAREIRCNGDHGSYGSCLVHVR